LASRFKPPIPKKDLHIPLQPINIPYHPPERNIYYPSSEKRENTTELFQDETLMGAAVKATFGAKDTSKAEKVDPTIEALWEVEWYARKLRLQLSYLTGPLCF
jgi:hypothetical protein